MILVIDIHHGDRVFSLLNQELKYDSVLEEVIISKLSKPVCSRFVSYFSSPKLPEPSCCFQQIASIPGSSTFFNYCHSLVLFCLYPAHKVRLVDPIVPGAILTEAEEDGVDGHAVNTNEGVGYQVSEQD